MYAGLNYDQLFGEASVQSRQSPVDSKKASFFLNDVKPIIDHRSALRGLSRLL